MTALLAMACGDKKAADTEVTAPVKAADSLAGATQPKPADKSVNPGDSPASVTSALGAVRKVGSFDSVELLGSIDLEISQGDFAPIRIEASDDDLPKVVTEIDGETLNIRCHEKNKAFTKCGPILVHVVLPRLKSLQVRGSGGTKGMTAFQSDTVSLGVHGSGNIGLEIHTKQLDLNIQGSANASLSGAVGRFQATIQGSGSLLARKLETKETNVTILGSGSVKIHVSDALDVSIMGSGSVAYTGAAKMTKSVQGAGSVRHVD